MIYHQINVILGYLRESFSPSPQDPPRRKSFPGSYTFRATPQKRSPVTEDAELILICGMIPEKCRERAGISGRFSFLSALFGKSTEEAELSGKEFSENESSRFIPFLKICFLELLRRDGDDSLSEAFGRQDFGVAVLGDVPYADRFVFADFFQTSHRDAHGSDR